MSAPKTDKNKWDEYWDFWYMKGSDVIKLMDKKLNKLMRYDASNHSLDLFFKKFLRKGPKKILDIGCAPGKWLVYFRKKFDFEVYGVDYSERGCKITNNTLRIFGVRGTIICQDFFNSTFQNKYHEFFDVILSIGLIEHFSNPIYVIDAHLNLLKKRGTLIIVIPNYSIGSLYRRLQPQEHLLRTHNVELMELSKFEEVLKSLDIKIEFLGYVGPIDISIAFKNPIILFTVKIFGQIIGYLTIFMNFKFLSPYIALVATKR